MITITNHSFNISSLTLPIFIKVLVLLQLTRKRDFASCRFQLGKAVWLNITMVEVELDHLSSATNKWRVSPPRYHMKFTILFKK
jgi:hypothetical protein